MLSEQWISAVRTELEAIDFTALYESIKTNKTYDKTGLRRLALLAIFLADEKRLGQYIAPLGHYEQLLREDDYTMILEEVLRVVVLIEKVVKPETTTNRLYI